MIARALFNDSSSDTSMQCDSGYSNNERFESSNDTIITNNNNKTRRVTFESSLNEHELKDSLSLTDHYIDETLSLSSPTDLDSFFSKTPIDLPVLKKAESFEMVEKPEIIDQSFIRNLLEAAYQHDEKELLSNTWKPTAMSSPSHKKIIMRELSYDDEKDLTGVDLMAPVFLAVTDEGSDNLIDMVRQSKSIEDLCSTTLTDGMEEG